MSFSIFPKLWTAVLVFLRNILKPKFFFLNKKLNFWYEKKPCLHYKKKPLKNHSLQENFFYECGPSCVPFTYLRTWKFLIHEQDRWYFGGPCQNPRELVKYSTIFITNLLPYKSFKLYFASNNFLCIFCCKIEFCQCCPSLSPNIMFWIPVIVWTFS